VPTNTPTPSILPFSDDFSDPSSGWSTYSDEEGSAFYQGGWLHVRDEAFGDFATNSYAFEYFTDFVLEVETKLIDGTDDNWHRILCRSDTLGNYYSFSISADGYYAINKWGNGTLTPLEYATYSTYIHQGQEATNLIHIECIGGTLSLSVNQHLLAEVTDDTFAGGDIALGADSLRGIQFTEVAFDNIVVTAPYN